jgi:predicted helicase
VLFLVPSIALLGQTLREWTAEAQNPIFPICICSDSEITKSKKDSDDTNDTTHDLALPASTNTEQILAQLKMAQKRTEQDLTVVFSTYQSIEVVMKAQKTLLDQPDNTNKYGYFDLIICDEAHRTTGVTLKGDDESSFIKVHKNKPTKENETVLYGKKRMYMTATPRLYSDDTKTKAREAIPYFALWTMNALLAKKCIILALAKPCNASYFATIKCLF